MFHLILLIFSYDLKQRDTYVQQVYISVVRQNIKKITHGN